MQHEHIPPSHCTSSCSKNIEDCSLWRRRLKQVWWPGKTACTPLSGRQRTPPEVSWTSAVSHLWQQIKANKVVHVKYTLDNTVLFVSSGTMKAIWPEGHTAWEFGLRICWHVGGSPYSHICGAHKILQQTLDKHFSWFKCYCCFSIIKCYFTSNFSPNRLPCPPAVHFRLIHQVSTKMQSKVWLGHTHLIKAQPCLFAAWCTTWHRQPWM